MFHKNIGNRVRTDKMAHITDFDMPVMGRWLRWKEAIREWIHLHGLILLSEQDVAP